VFIYHFNRLIHNKIVWGSFALIIALTFGLSGLFAGRQGGGGGGAAAGKLDGKSVGVRELDETVSTLRMMENARLGPGEESLPHETIFTQALVRIAMERLAGRLGLGVSNLEFQSDLRQEPAFQVNGVFSMAAYRRFHDRFRNMSLEQFEDHIFQNIAEGKIRAIVQTASWVSPSEVEDQLANITDRLTIHYAVLEDKFALSDIAPSEQQVRDFYDNNPDVFMIPAKTAVEYVAIPFTNYIPRLVITHEDLLEYYEDNIDDYSHFEEVAQTEEEDDGENGEDGAETWRDTTPRLVQRDIEEVAGEITAILQQKWARDAAETDAHTNLLEIATGPGGLPAVAALFGLDVETSDLFGVEGPAGFENPARFALQMRDFIEEDGVATDVRDVFMGNSLLYVFSPSDYTAANLPPFEEVRAQATTLATAKVKSDYFLEQQQSLHASIQAALGAGKTFEEAATDANLAPTNIVLTVNELSYNPAFPGAYNIAFAAMNLQKGSLAKPTAIPLQGVAFVYLADREPGDSMALEFMREDLQDRMTQNQTMFIQNQWGRWFESQLQYVPNNRAAAQSDFEDFD